MQSKNIYAVVAMDRQRCIGKKNALPWTLPEDLKRFKSLTMDSALIMGRSTYESIGRPLPGRTMIVVSRDPQYTAEGCVVVGSINDALAACPVEKDIWVIGGGEVYKQMLDMCHEVYLTEVAVDVDNGDTFFPVFDDTWELKIDMGWKQRGNDEFPTRYAIWGRKDED